MRYEMSVIRALTALSSLMVQLSLLVAIILLSHGHEEGFVDMLAATLSLAAVRYGRRVLADREEY